MRKGTLKNLVEHFEKQNPDNKRLAWEDAAAELGSLFESKKVDPASISIKEAFEDLVGPVADFQRAGPEVIAEAVHSSSFPTVTNEIINSIIIPQYETEVGSAGMIIEEGMASKTGQDKVAGFTAADGPEMRREFMAYQEVTFGEKYITVDMADFGRMISLSREMIFDDRTGEVVRLARDIGKKAGQHRAKYIIQTLEMRSRSALGESATRGFVYNGTVVTQAQFYANTHATVIDKQVNDNLVTDTLGPAGLKNALTLFGQMVDENSDEISVTPKLLIVPIALQTDGWELLKTQLKTDTAENNANYWGPMGPTGVSLMVSPFLQYDHFYYVGDPKSQLLWLWVWKPETLTQGVGSDLAFSNQVLMRVRYSYNGGIAHTDYRHIVKGGSA